MAHPDLFQDLPLKQPSVDSADSRTKADRQAPNSMRKRSPGEALYQTLLRTADSVVHRDLHPRNDKLWIVRTNGAYHLTIRRGTEEYPFTHFALQQFAAHLDVPQKLLDRLASFPRIEDCRLLNMLLFAEGAKDDAIFRFRIRDGKIVSVHRGRFTALDLVGLAEQLRGLENDGEFRVRKYEIEENCLWVELEHGNRAPHDLSPLTNRATAKADYWREGVVLWSQEDGKGAVTVVPVLLRDWGTLVLPVVSTRSDVRKRRHAQHSQDALLQAVLKDLKKSREAPYAEMGERLKNLHERFLPFSGIHAFLENLRLPFPSRVSQDEVLRHVMTGRPTQFRVVAGVLRVAQNINDHARRFQVLTALARIVWSQSRPRKR